jgi:hypothetical protein
VLSEFFPLTGLETDAPSFKFLAQLVVSRDTTVQSNTLVFFINKDSLVNETNLLAGQLKIA